MIFSGRPLCSLGKFSTGRAVALVLASVGPLRQQLLGAGDPGLDLLTIGVEAAEVEDPLVARHDADSQLALCRRDTPHAGSLHVRVYKRHLLGRPMERSSQTNLRLGVLDVPRSSHQSQCDTGDTANKGRGRGSTYDDVLRRTWTAEVRRQTLMYVTYFDVRIR